MWQLDCAMKCPDIWSHIILEGSLRVFLDEWRRAVRTKRLTLPWVRRNFNCLTALCWDIDLPLDWNWSIGSWVLRSPTFWLEHHHLLSPSACWLQILGLLSLYNFMSLFIIFLYNSYQFIFSRDPWVIDFVTKSGMLLSQIPKNVNVALEMWVEAGRVFKCMLEKATIAMRELLLGIRTLKVILVRAQKAKKRTGDKTSTFLQKYIHH